MNQAKSIKSLFDQNPRSWGLHGDPHLWDEMKTHFEGTALPASTRELTTLLEETVANPPADGSSLRWELIEVVIKETADNTGK